MKNGFGKTEAYWEREKAFYILYSSFFIRSEATILHSSFSFLLFHLAEYIAKEKVGGVLCDGAFVLSPEEGPIVFVFDIVGLEKKQAGNYSTSNEGEVGTVVSVCHILRFYSHAHHEWEVAERMATKNEIGRTENVVARYDVWKILVCPIAIDSLRNDGTIAAPTCAIDIHAVGIGLEHLVQLFLVFLHVRT